MTGTDAGPAEGTEPMSSIITADTQSASRPTERSGLFGYVVRCSLVLGGLVALYLAAGL